MILARYLGKLFLFRLGALIFGFIGVLFIFEAIMTRGFLQIDAFLIKMPLILHQVFPFLVILSILLFLWRLMRFHELEILHSAGLSLWFILRVPFFIVTLLSVCDLSFLVPWGQKVINPFKEKQGKLSLDSAGWHVRTTPQDYSIMRLDRQKTHIFTFSLDSTFKRHITAENAENKGSEYIFKYAWEMTPYAPPHFVECLKEKIQGLPKHNNQHPGLMSFTETSQALENSHIPKEILHSRQDYLLSHMVWILSLVPLGAALSVGRTRGYKKMIHIVLGLMFCASLYLVKEWTYKIILSLSFMWQPLSLWVVPLFTFLVAFIILFEKKEL